MGDRKTNGHCLKKENLMAVNIDPKRMRKIVLAADAKDKNPRTVMVFRKTCREANRFEDVSARWNEYILLKAKDRIKDEGDCIMTEVISCLHDQTHSWIGITHPRTGKSIKFDEKKNQYEDMFTPAEVWELFSAFHVGEILELIDAKKSRSQSPTPSAKSVRRARKKS